MKSTVNGGAKRRGVKYGAANGGKMENMGEKKESGLERSELHHISSHGRGPYRVAG